MSYLYRVVIFMACIVLNACSGNPLQKHTPQDSARLINEVCSHSMRQLGFNQPGMGDRYAQCMEHQLNNTFNCGLLYKTMTKSFQDKGVKITTAHLTDPQFYQHIKEELLKRSYFTF